MSDAFIDQLVGDLQPRTRLSNWRLWAHCTGCLVVVATIILSFMGLRFNHQLALQNGAMFWKPAIFLGAWIGSILLITDISRPLGDLKKIHTIPIIAACGLLIWQFFQQTQDLSWMAMVQSLNSRSALTCLSVIMGGGVMTMIIIWKYWLSKTASPHPTLLGTLAGFSAGSLAATAYALHCDHDAALYIAVYYGLPILLLTLIGAFLGRRLLRW